MHSCAYLYCLCSAVLISTAFAQLCLSFTACAQLCLSLLPVHSCAYLYYLCTAVLIFTACAQLCLSLLPVHSCAYLYCLCTAVLISTACAQLCLSLLPVHSCVQIIQNEGIFQSVPATQSEVYFLLFQIDFVILESFPASNCFLFSLLLASKRKHVEYICREGS